LCKCSRDKRLAVRFKRLANAWVPLSIDINAIQRSMGQRDTYPFVMSAPVITKLIT
jgi:hypothetical protein